MPTNDNDVNERRQTIHNDLDGFVTCRSDTILQPLRLTDTPFSKFSAELDSYLSVLNGGGSLALSRGEVLASSRLNDILETFFKSPRPTVQEGPQLRWTTVALFAGPNFGGPATLKIGESVVDLAKNDLEMLRSGRPWRFLNPWPDEGDCEKELESAAMALQELDDARQIMHQVLNSMSVIEQRLKDHTQAVTRRFEGQHLATSQERILEQAVVRVDSSDRCTFGADILKEDPSRVRGQPPIRTDIRDPSISQIVQPIIDNSHGDKPTDGSPILQRDRSTASPGSRLHQSDFIQELSDILDDPGNAVAMCWSQDGRSIFFPLENELPAPLLERLSTKSYESLVRRLYYYGFHKAGRTYYHDQFIRGQPSSIVPLRQMSPSPSHHLLVRNSSRSGPRIKLIPRKRTRESV